MADAATLAARAAWLVEAELDLGLESPAEAQALRRQIQMQRLATRLQGVAAAATDPRERLMQWLLLEGGEASPGQGDHARLLRIVACWSDPAA